MPGSRRHFSLGLLAALLLAPAPASAQFRVIPQVGLYAAATELPSAGDAVSFGKRESSLAYGGALELGPGLRFTVLHATDSEVPVSGVGCSACARSTVTAATAALVIRPLPTLVFVQPLVLLGAGVKRYDFTREDLSDEGARAILSDANDITGHLGLGLELGLGVVRGRLELQDLVSRFDAPDVEASFQHDLFVTFGVVVGG